MKRDGFVVHMNTSRFTEMIASPAQRGVVGPPDPAYRLREEGCADWALLDAQGLKEYLGHPHRKLMDVPHEMPRVMKPLELMPETVPHFSTVWMRKRAIPMKWWRAIPMKRWRAILDQSVELYDLGKIQEIDATGVARVQACQYYAKRTDYTFEAVKTTLLVGCETRTILDIHCSMEHPNNIQVGWQMLVWNLQGLKTDERGAGFGVFRTGYLLIGATGTAVIGAIADSAGWEAAFGLLSGLFVVLLLLTMAIYSSRLF